MPKITVSKKKLKKSLGTKLSDEKLEREISFLGTDFDGFVGDEGEIEIFPNRPDLLSRVGLVRSLKQFLDINTGFKDYKALDSDFVVNIEKSVKNVRPKTSCVVVKNLSLNQDLLDQIIELQEKLHVTYGRRRKKVAIGVYPLDKIKWPITYKAISKDKVSFKPLGKKEVMSYDDIVSKTEAGKKYKDLVANSKIAIFEDSDENVLSIPPIINSDDVGKVQEKTTEVFIECSGFDQDAVDKALDIICAFFSDVGGKLYKVKVCYDKDEFYTPKLGKQELKVSKNYIESKLGFKLTKKEIKECFQRMGYKVKNNDFSVIVPCYRTDVLGKIDLVEDVAIGYKFYNIDIDKDFNYTIGSLEDKTVFKEKVTDLLVGLGYVENYSYNLVDSDFQKISYPNKKFVKTINHVSERYDSLRYKVFISLLNNLVTNQNNRYPQKIFEIGRSFEYDKNEETGVKETESLGICIASEDNSFTQIRSIIELLNKNLDINLKIISDDKNIFLPGRGASVVLNEEVIGFIGQLHPRIISTLKLKIPISILEIDLEILQKHT